MGMGDSGTGFRLIVVAEKIGFGSRFEEVLGRTVEDKEDEAGHEADESEREEEEVADDEDDEEVVESLSTNSTNESRYSNCSIASNRYHIFAIFSSNVNGASEISSFKAKLSTIVCKAFIFNFSYLVSISKDS